MSAVITTIQPSVGRRQPILQLTPSLQSALTPYEDQENCRESLTDSQSTQLLTAIDLPLTVSTNEPSCYKITGYKSPGFGSSQRSLALMIAPLVPRLLAMEYINFDQVPGEDAVAQADLPTKENPQEPPVEPTQERAEDPFPVPTAAITLALPVTPIPPAPEVPITNNYSLFVSTTNHLLAGKSTRSKPKLDGGKSEQLFPPKGKAPLSMETDLLQWKWEDLKRKILRLVGTAQRHMPKYLARLDTSGALRFHLLIPHSQVYPHRRYYYARGEAMFRPFAEEVA
ncbi:hypothetical protein Pst134EA_015934 [Puccinia striiformis f. sp. tritici]|uniref:hypothetical protein n=1 Tax=Puccinia striiformis f. sp. tritici TaxID=168172 RepID=UPI0020082C3B|nr:hypothetical protein Pst134EA_015934 [Puccinia striiformis f. sp. tritici]KAH9463853.1 hypothetical protein Pst134EA_015934 [Puccinia striiformis f. sp. tritici]